MRSLALLVVLSSADALRCAPALQPSALRTVLPPRTSPPVALSPRTIAGGSGTALVVGLVARVWQQANAADARRTGAQAAEMAAADSQGAEDAAADLAAQAASLSTSRSGAALLVPERTALAP